ncbi:hypothetical protein Tco_1338050 [Tanacetum coccineum]
MHLTLNTMTKLAFCDYHNMVAILEKTKSNTDFHQIVDFLEASHIRYALTVRPTVYVSHIQQFWSTARVETVDGETNIIAKVNGRQRTVTESSIKRHLKLLDDEGISNLPDNELFENLSLMGYNISPNQRFSFQKGQFSHQWKFLIHTVMQCLSPKSNGFNEFSSNIATTIVCLATNRVYNFSKMIFDGMVRNIKSMVKFLMFPRFIEIFRYLKGQPKLGLWYPKESPFDLVSYSDSDYGGANQDRKSTTGGCQFLGRRLISWQCKKHTIVATSTTEAEYVAAASGCRQVLWIQNQLLDYGYNFMNTKIYIDNNSAICIVKNPVYHSKTKHIEIRHHFIRDCYEKKLINVDHIHTDDNVADLLTKAFDVGRFQYLVDGHVMKSTLNIMTKLAFYDYHNMVAILEKIESNTDFHQIVDFLEASHIRYALTVHPTVYVSHIQQFWSTARVEIVDGETKIIAKVNGRQRTVTESSIRRHLKLLDDEGINTLPDNELFENLSLMGYNISPNQRFSFQKGQFSY